MQKLIKESESKIKSLMNVEIAKKDKELQKI